MKEVEIIERPKPPRRINIYEKLTFQSGAFRYDVSKNINPVIPSPVGEVTRKKAILVRVNKLYHDHMSGIEKYEATRRVWKVGLRREKAKFAFMLYRGEVKAIYRIKSWHPAGSTAYSSRSEKDINIEGRWEFLGIKAEERIVNKYIGNDVSHYFKQGNSNTVDSFFRAQH